MRRALIFGRAQGVWDEIAEAHKLGAYDFIIGVGSAAVDYPHEFDDWVSFHATLFPHWLVQREHKRLPMPRRLWSSLHHRNIQVKERLGPGLPSVTYIHCDGGSSGYIAVEVARTKHLCERIVLCGIPMDPERAQYDSNDGRPWQEALKHRKVWEANAAQMQGIVRSVSGWTQQLLGGEPPTRDWLTGGH